jgi:type IX secretion system PorP/SprF family membrane protein
MRLKLFLFFGISVLCVFNLSAQDIHFSQFHVSPLLQNPANAGYFNCNYRFTAIYRSQWNSVTVPYKTFAGSYDMRFVSKQSSKKDIFGAGAVLFSDKAGDGDFTHSNFGVAGSYHKNVDKFFGINYLGGGVMMSYGGGSIDYMKLRFPDQYVTPGVINPTSAEAPFNSFNYFDMSAGIEYNWLPDNKQNHVQIGAAIYHINEPKKTFRAGGNSRISRKYLLHGSGQIRTGERLVLFPKAQYSRQLKNNELMFGTLARLDLDKMKNDLYGVYVGLFTRIVGDSARAVSGDALIFVTRLDVKQLSIAFSYDINVSSLSPASSARGGPELSLIYIGCLPRSSGKLIYCPRF